MWNLATNLRESISNNKQMIPNLDVKLPFALAIDNEQLEKDIMEFNKEKYDKVLGEFHEKVGVVFDGKASQKLVRIIEKQIIGA